MMNNQFQCGVAMTLGIVFGIVFMILLMVIGSNFTNLAPFTIPCLMITAGSWTMVGVAWSFMQQEKEKEKEKGLG